MQPRSWKKEEKKKFCKQTNKQKHQKKVALLHPPSNTCLLLLLLRAARFWRGLREATTIGLLLLPRAEVVLVLAEAFLGRLFCGEEEERKRVGLRRFSNDDNTVGVIFFRSCKNEELFLLPLFRRRRRRSRNGSETEFSRARIYQSLNSPYLSSARQPLERF